MVSVNESELQNIFKNNKTKTEIIEVVDSDEFKKQLRHLLQHEKRFDNKKIDKFLSETEIIEEKMSNKYKYNQPMEFLQLYNFFYTYLYLYNENCKDLIYEYDNINDVQMPTNYALLFLKRTKYLTKKYAAEKYMNEIFKLLKSNIFFLLLLLKSIFFTLRIFLFIFTFFFY